MKKDKIVGCLSWIAFFCLLPCILLVFELCSGKDKKGGRGKKVETVATSEIKRMVYNKLDSIFEDRLDGWNAEMVDSPLTVTFYGHYKEKPYAPIFKVGSMELEIKNELSDFIYDFVILLSDTNVSNYVDAVTIRTCPGSHEINAIPDISRLLAVEKKRIYSLFWNTDSIWNHNARLRDYKKHFRDTVPVLPEYMNVYYDWLVCYHGADELGRSEFRMRNTIPFSIDEVFGDTVNPYRFDWDIPYGRPLDWILSGDEEPFVSRLENGLVLVMELERNWVVYHLWHDICNDLNDLWLNSLASGDDGKEPVYDAKFKVHVFPYKNFEYYEREVEVDTPFFGYSEAGEIKTSERIIFRIWFNGEETKWMSKIGDSTRIANKNEQEYETKD